MWSALFARILTPRSAPPSCYEEQQLRADWEDARQPSSETALERLELLEERKFLARAALVAHRQTCSLCLSQNAASSTGEGTSGYGEDPQDVAEGESVRPNSRKAA